MDGMTATSNIAVLSNNSTDMDVGISRHAGRQISAVMRVARSLWPTKLPQEIQARTGISQRHAERLVAERAGVSGDVLAGLLRSEEGLHFLTAIIEADGTPPSWWAGFKYQAEVAQFEAGLAEARAKLRHSKRAMRSGR
jgi:hypothetical protein